jgi:hypothetical protein
MNRFDRNGMPRQNRKNQPNSICWKTLPKGHSAAGAKKLVKSLLSAERVSFEDVREMQYIVKEAKGDKK